MRSIYRLTLALVLAAASVGAWVAPATSPGGYVALQPQGSGTPPPVIVGGACTPSLTSHGGPVIQNPQVTAVFWGNNVDPQTKSSIGGFYSTILGSSYFSWLSEYGVGKGSYSGSTTIHPAQTSGTITDQEIRQELEREIENGSLSDPGPNSLYMLYFPPGMTIVDNGLGSCPLGPRAFGFCGYHDSFTFTDRQGKTHTVRYAVIPDLNNPGCGIHRCGDGPTTFDNLTSVSSHELVEAATDPAPLDEKSWRDYGCTGGEIGDLCNHEHATVDGYTVQKQWDNYTHSCTAQGGLIALPWVPLPVASVIPLQEAGVASLSRSAQTTYRPPSEPVRQTGTIGASVSP